MKAPIDSLDHYKDLGVTMSSSGDFSDHLDIVLKKVRKTIVWVCQTFASRDVAFMRQIYVSVVHPHIDYCSQLWGPGEGPQLDRLEKVQSYFTRLIPDIRDKSYTERFKILNLTTIQKRFERYRIMYLRKIILGLVPNPGLVIRREGGLRGGLTLDVPKRKTESVLRLNSFIIKGPAIFDCLPTDLHSLDDSMDTFKLNFDQFLYLIPDNPSIDGGGSNGLEEQIRKWTWSLR